MSVIEKISVQGKDYDIKDKAAHEQLDAMNTNLDALTEKMEGILKTSLKPSDLKMNTAYIIRLIFPDNSDDFRNNYCYIKWSEFPVPDIDYAYLNHYAEIRFTPTEANEVTIDTNATCYHIAEAKELQPWEDGNNAYDAGEIFCLHSLINKCMHPSESPNIVYGTTSTGSQVTHSLATESSLGDGYIPVYRQNGIDAMPFMSDTYTVPVGNPVGKYDAVNKQYADQFACYEQEHEVTYGTWSVFHDRDHDVDGVPLDIDQVELSCILHDETGGYCYVSHDITRMVQAVPDDGSKGVYKLTGVYADFNSNGHKTYSFKITIRRTGYMYEIYPEWLFIGNLCKEVNGGNVSMTTIKTRTIFTRYIKEI